MKKLNLTIAIPVIFIFLGCSSKAPNPVQPLPGGVEASPSVIVESNRNLLGMWEAIFDLDTMTADVQPSRDLLAHYNVTGNLPIPRLKLKSYDSSKKIIDIDATITNNSSYDVHDLRLIVFTDNIGHLLLNDDNWTSLWDITGGEDINPFKAYAKSDIHRKFAKQASYTENFKIYLPGGKWPVKFAIDASYPANCKEPYEISNFTQEELLNTLGAKADIHIEVTDWQNDIDSVSLFCPSLLGASSIPFSITPRSNWGLRISNNTGAQPGIYTGIVNAVSVDSGLLNLYDKVDIMVSKEEYNPFNPVDVTPPYLTFKPNDIYVVGNLLFISSSDFQSFGSDYGLLIYDVSNPSKPLFVNIISSIKQIDSIVCSNGYAFILSDNWYIPNNKLFVLDIDPIENIHVVKTLDICGFDLKISGNYLYIAAGLEGVYILSINPPEETSIIKNIDTPGYSKSIDIMNSFAYVADGDCGVQIIDVSQPELSQIVSSFGDSYSYKIVTINSCVYVISADEEFHTFYMYIMSNPVTPVLKLGLSYYSLNDIYVINGYAYLTISGSEGQGSLQIWDVDPPQSAHDITTYEIYEGWFGHINHIFVDNGYTYIANGSVGIDILDVSQPEFPSLTSVIKRINYGSCVYLNNNLMYIADRADRTFNIIDVSQPENSKVLKSLPLEYYMIWPTDVFATHNYSCVASDGLLQILNVEIPEQARVVKNIQDYDIDYAHIYMHDNHIYVPVYNGLYIYDMSIPESTYLERVVEFDLAYPYSVYIDGDYAFAASDNYLYVVDISIPETAYLKEKISINSDSCSGIFVVNGYAYISGSRFQIIDISPLENASVVKTLDSVGGNDLYVADDYAYLANGEKGLQIVDITPPENAKLVENIFTHGCADDIYVHNNYAYVTNTDYCMPEAVGLRIIKLW